MSERKWTMHEIEDCYFDAHDSADEHSYDFRQFLKRLNALPEPAEPLPKAAPSESEIKKTSHHCEYCKQTWPDYLSWHDHDCSAAYAYLEASYVLQSPAPSVKLTAESETPKCPRCRDLYYDPKVMLQDARQRAAEWEDEANKAEKRIAELEVALEATSANFLDLEERFRQVARAVEVAQKRIEQLEAENARLKGAK